MCAAALQQAQLDAGKAMMSEDQIAQAQGQIDAAYAALDEANVQKYATYLKRFSHNTQLMVITHRRGTIELCDVLYGVYMQEKGVSGLLRQEFSEEFLNEVENA